VPFGRGHFRNVVCPSRLSCRLILTCTAFEARYADLARGLPNRTRRANGTSTTRRPSLSTTLTHSSNPLGSSASSNVYHPPHHYNRQATANTTYSKEEILNLFKAQESNGSVSSSKLLDLVDSDFGTSSTVSGGWGRSGDEISVDGVGLCWDKDGGVKPISLEEMTEEEREVCHYSCRG
jgi:PERQ amino acid-rich with GYF domain-containing protein